MPRIQRRLQTLADVGLGYIRLGQPATTLSGAKRSELSSYRAFPEKQRKNFYILDEPTTGLHIHDIKKLLAILERLTENGDTVVVIEHHMEVIKRADSIIDLGPEGGDRGGTIVAAGAPEEVALVKNSYTAEYLKRYLKLPV